MSKSIKIRKGLDIRIKGDANRSSIEAPLSSTYAIKPTDFHGLIPKILKRVGDQVKAGTPIFQDKYRESIKYVSPVSGKIQEIKRGAKRKILEVIIEADKVISYEAGSPVDVASLDREKAKEVLLASGLWPFIKMRPIDVVANYTDTPKSIFISGFDSSPLAPDYDYLLYTRDKEFQAGVDILNKLTDGNINLQLRAKGGADAAFTQAKKVVTNKVSGPHPAGNVGPQIHQIDPINKGEVIWTVNAQDVAIIGRYLLKGQYDASKLVALTGSEAINRKYYRVIIGANASDVLNGNCNTDNVRYISGNILTGSQIEADGYIGFYDSQITVIPEGNEYKFFLTKGWLGLGFNKLSNNSAYPSKMLGPKKFDVDTNLNGEERAFVVTGEYEKVFPFDIYPVHLIKSVMINDIDSMEKLGIYEVAPEDFALCEFVCTSKINSQEIVRQGLDVIHKECM
jgi:Na+-transporting NADH:ubiquinone oxidoreductase subunit A